MVLEEEGGRQVSCHHGIAYRHQEAQRRSAWSGNGEKGDEHFRQTQQQRPCPRRAPIAERYLL